MASARGRKSPEGAAEGRPARARAKHGRADRGLLRAERGTIAPIRVADLVIDEEQERRARASGAVDVYARMLQKNASAQPGRPLVNVVKQGDGTRYELLSLHALVLASRDAGVDVLHALLVRLPDEEARQLAAIAEADGTSATAPKAPEERLSPRDIAAVSGFLELPIADIITTENLRKSIDTTSADFASLVESIRTIGLQNPPVVEVRPPPSGGEDALVCVSGHRRLKALEVLGHERVTCALKLFKSEKHRTLATLAENINRRDLHFLDKAEGYGVLVDQGMTVLEIASLLDSDPRTVGKYLRASRWDPTVKDRVRALGPRMTTRFLLNYLAAGERTTEELHTLLAKFEAGVSRKDLPRKSRSREIEAKLEEYFELAESTPAERATVEKALKFLGLLR